MVRYVSPKLVLALFTTCNLLNYYDRGVIGGQLNYMRRDKSLGMEGENEAGALAAAFIVGFMCAAPVFAHLAHRFSSTKLMSVGLLVWAASALLSGLAPEFYTLLLARACIGVGEASFAGLAPTVVDDIAPKAQRTVWIGIFFSAIPIGQALGYVVAGNVAEFLSWRATFVSEAVIMIPFIVIIFLLPQRLLKQQRASAAAGTGKGNNDALPTPLDDESDYLFSSRENVPLITSDPNLKSLGLSKKAGASSAAVSIKPRQDSVPPDVVSVSAASAQSYHGGEFQSVQPDKDAETRRRERRLDDQRLDDSDDSGSDATSREEKSQGARERMDSDDFDDDLDVASATSASGRDSDSDSDSASASSTSTSSIGVEQADIELVTFKSTLLALWRNKVYVNVVLGLAAQTFVIGCLGFFVPDYLTNRLHMKGNVISTCFGIVTVATGLFGTAYGGWLGDRGGTERSLDARTLFSLRIASWITLAGTPIGMAAFLFGVTWWSVFPLMMMCEFMLFSTTAPINSTLLSVVEPHLRSSAMALSIFVIHALGDFPSPVIVGQVIAWTRADPDDVHNATNTQWVMTGLAGVVFFNAAFWWNAKRIHLKNMRHYTPLA